ncbi:hypothetical protein HII36_31285 [Nonomuraea sp. NN258]|uniref:hypothetical protein n=1 Tax=Nonomuraea antri TaxID=2730852 RepID=UPI00156A1A90|nr:hypothetical protein [Nonomuraea antri]NRQ36285.1 hypothetical protein [Nonomuraea antri]
MLIDLLDAGLPGRDHLMPGSNRPVHLTPLPETGSAGGPSSPAGTALSDGMASSGGMASSEGAGSSGETVSSDGGASFGGFASLVRYPVGWSRPERGHCLAGEEFVLLEGELHISGISYRPGHHAWIPAGALRHSCSAPGGALVLAFAAGEPAWVPSDLDVPDGPSLRTPLESVVIPDGGLPLTPRSALLDTPVTLDQPAAVVTVPAWTWEISAFVPDGRVLVRWTA